MVQLIMYKMYGTVQYLWTWCCNGDGGIIPLINAMVETSAPADMAD